MLKTVSTQLALASDTLSEILAKGNTSGSNDIAMDAGYGIGQSDGLAIVDFPGSNVITASTSGEESFRVDAQGQLRLKNSAPVWDTTFSALVTKGGFVTSQNPSYLYSGQNSYFDGGFKYSVDGYSTLYEQSFGQHSFYSSVSGTAGDAVSYVPKMTLNPTGVLYPVGGINLGGTAAANLLDDYEEGSFVPTYQGVTGGSWTYGVQSGSYTKIGNMVTVRGEITTSAGTGLSGNIQINLPYTSALQTTGTLMVSNLAKTVDSQLTMFTVGANTRLYEFRNNGPYAAQNYANLGAVHTLFFSISYTV
jgi:hypothetical protein